MEPLALESYRRPSYPARNEALADPAFLQEHVPSGWQPAAGILSAVALSLACGAHLEARETTPAPAEKPDAKKEEPAGKTAEPVTGSQVAPVPKRGEGRGAMGCNAITPPVYITETEALEIINDKFAEYGITMTRQEVEWEDIKFAPKFRGIKRTRSGKAVFVLEEIKQREQALSIDGMTADGRIAFEFVSCADHEPLGGSFTESQTRTYELRRVALEVAQRLKADGRPGVYFGLFYDPLEKPDYAKIFHEQRFARKIDVGKEKKKAKDRAVELLKAQVDDFAAWLKTQGVLSANAGGDSSSGGSTGAH
ncbi:MAG: hypothetical protein JW909_14065 [Planctomycetes bacterium]|nr:hypothetical protein [Planctomycetota bacterium]